MMGCCGTKKTKQHDTNSEPPKYATPLDLLKIRLARGEISFDEYMKVKAELVQ